MAAQRKISIPKVAQDLFALERMRPPIEATMKQNCSLTDHKLCIYRRPAFSYKFPLNEFKGGVYVRKLEGKTILCD